MTRAQGIQANINRANAYHSTGPRTPDGKARSALNALKHGLTSQSAVLPTENPADYQRHIQDFIDEHKPATPTEQLLTRELADTSWRLLRIPRIEAGLLARAEENALDEQARIQFDVVDALRAIATLGLHGQRLSRQFQKTLATLRKLQADRVEQRERDLKRAAGLLELHKQQGIPYDPAQDGFVFSNQEIEDNAQRFARFNEACQYEFLRSNNRDRGLFRRAAQ